MSSKQFLKLINESHEIKKQGTVTDIVGPFDGKINSIYKFNTESGVQFLFRARISQAFRYEDIIKEKILFPFLDGSLSADTPNLQNKVEKITKNKIGSYIFDEDIFSTKFSVRIQDLLYYDETKSKIPFIYAIYSYIPGESLYYPMERDRNSDIKLLKTEKYTKVFDQIGETLAKLHKIRFNGFYSDIRDIGNIHKSQSWKNIVEDQLQEELKEAKTHSQIKELLPGINRFFSAKKFLLNSEDNPVLFHNDFQSQNIIIQENNDSFKINGLIDFDNWRIGTQAQDFVKMQYWTIKGIPELNTAFLHGYNHIFHEIDVEKLQERIDFYKMLWFILVFNFEMDKIGKNELNADVDNRFPQAEKYIEDIRILLANYGF